MQVKWPTAFTLANINVLIYVWKNKSKWVRLIFIAINTWNLWWSIDMHITYIHRFSTRLCKLHLSHIKIIPKLLNTGIERYHINKCIIQETVIVQIPWEVMLIQLLNIIPRYKQFHCYTLNNIWQTMSISFCCKSW